MKKSGNKVNLDPEDQAWVEARAKAKRLSVSAVIREIIAMAKAAEEACSDPRKR